MRSTPVKRQSFLVGKEWNNNQLEERLNLKCSILKIFKF